MATSSTSASAGSARYGLSGAVGGADEAQVGVDGEDVGAEPGPGGQEGHAPRRRLEPEEEHALVDLHHLDLPVLAGGPPVRIERDGVEGDEPAHHLAHLAGGAEQARRRGRRRRRRSGRSGRSGRWRARRPWACGASPSRRCRSSCPSGARRRCRRRSCACRPSGAHCRGVGVALLDEGGPLLVGHAAHVELVGEALLEAVAALHVDGVDAVERLLGPPDDGRALGGDLGGQLECGRPEAVRRHHRGHRAVGRPARRRVIGLAV